MTKQIDWTKPIESTTSGRKLRYLGKLEGKKIQPFLFAYPNGGVNNEETIGFCNEFGHASGISFSVRNVPEKGIAIGNLYVMRDGSIAYFTNYGTLVPSNCVAVVPFSIEYYEGQGVV